MAQAALAKNQEGGGMPTTAPGDLACAEDAEEEPPEEDECDEEAHIFSHVKVGSQLLSTCQANSTS